MTSRQWGLVAFTGLTAVAVFLAVSRSIYGLGFPLDDSWIHATYARNLALRGEWAFQVGTLSAGSTSPLWTALLVPGYLLGVDPLWWSYALGVGILVLLAVGAERWARILRPDYHSQVPWIGFFIATEWHLLWAAVSGMETILHAALCSLVLLMVLRRRQNPALMGLLSGISVWVRPDGLTLVPVCLAALFLARSGMRERLRVVVEYLVGLGAVVVPYLAFNLALGGLPLPNTFYAKQAEYAAWQARPFLERLALGMLQLSTGPALLLWPAIALAAVHAFRTRDVRLLLALAWCLGYVGLYVVRLPAYQHARYLIPAMPMLFFIGLLGLLDFRQSRWPGTAHWALQLAWSAGVVMLQIGFVALGARAYGRDVALIESEMVTTAHWVSVTLPPGAIVAAHDIGALGYFDQHKLIDLAGLVSPEVIPFIRDETRLAEYLDEQGADYLVAFPNLYPSITRGLRTVYIGRGTWATEAGEGNLSVYCLACP